MRLRLAALAAGLACAASVGAVAGAAVSTPAAGRFPVRVDPTGRYLVDRTGRPFPILGDSPQAMTTNLSPAQAHAFLANRRAAGFTTVWVNLLNDRYTGGRPGGQTFDGIAPFRSPGDLATPDPAYFARVDAVLRAAARLQLLVILDPIETGGWLPVLRRNGVRKAFRYGAWLGARYRSFPNLLWMHGNDFQTWRRVTDDRLVLAVARGIRSTDPSHLHTVQLDFRLSSSRDDPRWRRLIDLDAVYTYAPTYAELLEEYRRRPPLPTFLVEANYEYEHDYHGSITLRRQAWWTALSGAAGQLYGNRWTWSFEPGWEAHVDTAGSRQLGVLARFLTARRWWQLVPDTGADLVAAGRGTYATAGVVDASDWAAAARTPDGRLAAVYVPTARTLTVDPAPLGGPVRARWLDPASGAYRDAEGTPWVQPGPRELATPGPNADGDGDWVLVLEAV